MTLSHFVIKNALRNKRRTILTVLSTGFSLFLLIALWTFLDMLFNPPSSDDSAMRLAVRRSTSLADQMPIAYMQKIKGVPHIKAVMPLQWFGGYYKEPKNFFANLAVDPDKFWDMFSELKTTEATRRAFAAERTGAVVGEGLMKRYGWKVGDRVTLIGTIFPVDLEFKIVGTFDYELADYNFYFRFDYLNEALGDPGEAGSFWLKADRAENIPGIIDTVDAMFHNSAAETKTETEKSFVLGFVAMLGNVKVLVGYIAVVVIFTMLLVSASTMAMTIRERIREVAILKSIGYPSGTILGLILGESIFIALLGVGTGCLFAVGLSHANLYELTQGFIQIFKPTAQVYAMVLATGIGIGVFSGLVPALQASRLTITEAMRRLE